MGTETVFSNFLHPDREDDVLKNREQIEVLLKGAKADAFTMFLNKGEEDEMELICFKRCKLKAILTYIFFGLTLGILRLVFHWVPHLYLYATSNKCKVEEAEMVMITEIFNSKHKIFHVRPLEVLTPESVAKLKLEENQQNHIQISASEEAPTLSVHFENGEFRNLEKLQMFSCKKVTYIWDSRKQEFMKLSGLENGVSCEVFHRYKGLTSNEQFMRLLVYGPNVIEVREQSILTLICLEVLNPFYIFQILSFTLWIVDDYYYYAGTIMAMSIFGIAMSVRQTRKNQRNLKSTIHSSDVCTVLRSLPKNSFEGGGDVGYRTETISTEFLVPGDIMEIPSHGCTMHCDAVLLTGNCILNESMLTGESVPVTKTALTNMPGVVYDPKEHGRHTLFCGTHVIQTRYFGNEKVLAVIVRTGFSTAKGSLVRSILYPPPVDFRFEKDSYRFVGMLGLIAGCGFLYTVVTKVMRGISAGELLVEALDLITITVPPALPAAMTVGRFYAQIRLKNSQIYCISPRSINVSGSVDCVCFDKTGTLTEDGLDLLCVVPIENNSFKSPVKNVETIPYNVLVYGLVSCHSLTIIDKQIVGDPLDLKMFESTKWVMEEPEVDDNSKFNMIFPTVLKPPKDRDDVSDDLQIGIIREFPFSSSSQRMGVIVRRLDGKHFEYYCKGSPEMLLNFVRPQSVPEDFHDVLESYAREGYRVIALAHKELSLSYTKVHKVQREAIEQDLDLMGLIVLENRLKPETTPSIEALNEARIRVIMVTGDNILTALSVAKDCGIVPPSQSIITVTCDNSDPPNIYYSLASSTKTTPLPTDLSALTNSASAMSLDTVESQVQTVTNGPQVGGANGQQMGGVNGQQVGGSKRPSVILNDYRFAMTGKVWGVLKEYYPEVMARICTRGNIFARMAPDQKQQLVQELQELGYCVAMCGDGANDCGALRAAHTGISLSDSESSVASPFTSKNPNITCVLKVIKEGRAALVTSFGIFKYMAAYSLCQFISVLILYSIDSNLTDMEFLYIDLFIISVFAFFFGKTESYPGKLVKETPLSSLLGLSPVLSLLFQIALVIVFQVAAFQHLKSESWYVPMNGTADEQDACVENYTIYTISSFQYIILAIVFSKGYPYRKSIFSNYGFVICAVVMTAISVYLALSPAQFIVDSFELEVPEDFSFRLFLLAYAGANFILSLLVERFLVEELFFKRLRFKFHNVDKSKRKYLSVERQLNRDRKWPAVTSVFESAASPASPLPTCTAEIVVEKENKFQKDHVLNKLYDGVQETGYFSQEELLFSSLPSENPTSSSGTFKSLSNNTNYDLASSNLNIPELPFDDCKSTPVRNSCVAMKIPRSSRESTPRKSMKTSVDVDEKGMSNFNTFGTSPPNLAAVPLEMNALDS
ncbi:unnamed protein product [Phaedon cochleariae]|uniref:Cation-transporting ATPase n=1 Tax=Phaedon cochleariae TaxID=80249 RepID=A0A9P0GRA4_PHACE|nr:unnamed protein product [Phaedon cochleariae]